MRSCRSPFTIPFLNCGPFLGVVIGGTGAGIALIGENIFSLELPYVPTASISSISSIRRRRARVFKGLMDGFNGRFFRGLRKPSINFVH